MTDRWIIMVPVTALVLSTGWCGGGGGDTDGDGDGDHEADVPADLDGEREADAAADADGHDDVEEEGEPDGGPAFCGNGVCDMGEDAASCPGDCGELRAFPGAEGFGSDTPGGRGGAVYVVTSLDDAGSGSLRECVEAEGPRTCVFATGGTIVLDSALSATSPFLTIAGQTAPGGGILLRNGPNASDSLDVATHDVIVRYVTIRRGPPPETSDVNGIGMYDNNDDTVYNIVIDHCSLGWTNDRILFTWYGARDYAIQWSIFSEGLDSNRNTKGPLSSKGVMLGSALAGEGSTRPGGRNVSFHHDLVAHCLERTPLVKPAGLAEVVNIVVYNSGWNFGAVDLEDQLVPVLANYLGNYFAAGPDTDSDTFGINVDHPQASGARIFVQDNIGPQREDGSLPEANVLQERAVPYRVEMINASNPPFPITVHACASADACDAYDYVLASAGNSQRLDGSGTFHVRRDAVDQRIIQEVSLREGRVIDAPGLSTCEDPSACRYLTTDDYARYGIDDPLDPDGWPVIEAGTAYEDADGDGMSDEWEGAHFGDLSRGSPVDSSSDYDGDGYTDLEEFLNATDPAG
jgi:hypothetical protein